MIQRSDSRCYRKVLKIHFLELPEEGSKQIYGESLKELYIYLTRESESMRRDEHD